jgi:hypothetical protein
MLFFVMNPLTTSEVCAGALSWSNNQSPFFRISGRLHLTFSLSSQNLAVQLPIDSLTLWHKLLMQNSSNVKKKKKKISTDLMLLRNWHTFFGHGQDGIFHCEDCCFVSGS